MTRIKRFAVVGAMLAVAIGAGCSQSGIPGATDLDTLSRYEVGKGDSKFKKGDMKILPICPELKKGRPCKGHYGKDSGYDHDYGKGDGGKGNYGKGDYGKGNYGKGDYGKADMADGASAGWGSYGKGDYGKGNYGKADYGKAGPK